MFVECLISGGEISIFTNRIRTIWSDGGRQMVFTQWWINSLFVFNWSYGTSTNQANSWTNPCSSFIGSLLLDCQSSQIVASFTPILYDASPFRSHGYFTSGELNSIPTTLNFVYFVQQVVLVILVRSKWLMLRSPEISMLSKVYLWTIGMLSLVVSFAHDGNHMFISGITSYSRVIVVESPLNWWFKYYNWWFTTKQFLVIWWSHCFWWIAMFHLPSSQMTAHGTAGSED